MNFRLQQIIAADYRLGLFKRLAELNSETRFIYAGETSYNPAQHTHDVCRPYVTPVENRYWLKRRLCWQKGIVAPLVEADQAILNFNVRILSNWKILSARRKTGKKTLLWGHAAGRLPQWIARPIYALHFAKCDGFIAYTESQKNELQRAFPRLPVWVAPNACLSAAESRPDPDASLEAVTDVLFVGRLIPAKKPLLLARAFHTALEQDLLPPETRLAYVGEGEQAATIRKYARENGYADRLVMHGHVSDVDKLRHIYGTSFVAVSPGYAGLSVTQALAFGNWLLVADKEPHSPEIEAVKPGFNGRFFTAGDPDKLAGALADAWGQRTENFAHRQEISTDTRRRYSFEAMTEAFISALSQ